VKSIRKIKNAKLRVIVFAILMIIVVIWFFMRIKTLSGVSEKDIVLSQNEQVVQSIETAAPAENTTVTKIIDGDTVEIEGGYRVRLLEIDTPEYGENCYQEAKDRLEELLLNKKVVLEKDQTDVDKYGRCLRYVFLNGENINLEMVQEGLANSDVFDSDIKYKTEVLEAESSAKLNKIGCLW